MNGSSIPALYRGHPLYLWVEDTTTQAYLDGAWGDGRIGFHIGGGAANIHAVCEDAWRTGSAHVFGLRDRDFGPTNLHRWAAFRQSDRVYVLDALEIENHLLDADALAGVPVNTARRSAADIEARMHAIAGGLVPWMATRAVISSLQVNATRDFPSHPKRSAVSTLADGEAYLLGNPWVTTTAPGTPALVAHADIRQRLGDAEKTYSAHLTQGSWRQHFAGKEIYEEVSGFVWNQNRMPSAHADLAKMVGEQQRVVGQVPVEISALRAALLARIGQQP
ncbi:MAG: hypothetical protein KC620_03095 [Myxococcales bacterium]|nr:hypothetical protein [Myxococcales bacterium]